MLRFWSSEGCFWTHGPKRQRYCCTFWWSYFGRLQYLKFRFSPRSYMWFWPVLLHFMRFVYQGRCHMERSGFEGPWTPNPLIFDNSYFKYVLYLFILWYFVAVISSLTWIKVLWWIYFYNMICWNYRELLSGEKEGLIQLPSDKALLEDPVFRPLVEKYAAVSKIMSFFHHLHWVYWNSLSLWKMALTQYISNII